MNGMTYCFKPNQERSSCSFHGRKNTQWLKIKKLTW